MTETPAPRKKSIAREYLESIVVAIILALFIRTFAVQAFKIPTGSMETNLLVGDHLLVNKVLYSPSLGRFEDLMLAKKPIRRGHVVIFKYPDDPNKDYVKRVIGLPGETVEIRDKAVLIDGKPLEEHYTRFEEPPLRRDDPEYGFRAESERDNYGPVTVPPGPAFRDGGQPRQQPRQPILGVPPGGPGEGAGGRRVLVVRRRPRRVCTVPRHRRLAAGYVHGFRQDTLEPFLPPHPLDRGGFMSQSQRGEGRLSSIIWLVVFAALGVGRVERGARPTSPTSP